MQIDSWGQLGFQHLAWGSWGPAVPVRCTAGVGPCLGICKLPGSYSGRSCRSEAMRRAEAGPLSNHPFFFETQHTLRAPLPLPYCYLVFSTHHLKPKHHSIQQPLVRPANTPDSGSANALKWRRCRRLPCSRWCICKTALSTCPRRWHRCYPMPMRYEPYQIQPEFKQLTCLCPRLARSKCRRRTAVPCPRRSPRRQHRPGE